MMTLRFFFLLLQATLSDEHVRLRNLSTSLEDNGEKESKLSLISETCNQLLIDSVTAADCSDNELITDTSLMKNIRISCDGSEVTVEFFESIFNCFKLFNPNDLIHFHFHLII